MDMINIPKTNSAINSLNKCVNLFQWVISATSSLKYQWSRTQLEKLQVDVQKLQSDHQYLCDSLPRIYDLIDRAEWRTHDKYVPDLLPKLKDAVYDAEDLLDDFRWYEAKVSVEGNAISVKQVIDFIQSVTQGGFNKVTDIQKRLDHLSTDLEKVGSLQPIPRFGKPLRSQTTSLRSEEKIFGRDKEKDDLIRLLGVPTKNTTDPSGSKRERSSGVPVLPIVGIGGVGKTTLAQDICNHSKVKCHFDLIIWICVSEHFDVDRLTKQAIEQSHGEVQKKDNLNSLQVALKKSLDSKRFLPVLDDMWDEDEQDWKQFCAPFRDVTADGSMILVTTRSAKVADVVHTMDPFLLKGLNDDVFWKFFKLCAFGSDSSSNYPELERIGEKILPKLKGSPLAAKTLGRLLRRKLDPLHWKGILNSELWENRQEKTDILSALRLSYMYLPPYLKRCFSFCAVYPKHYKFKKEDLAEIWVAEGLVEQEPNIPLHHTGAQYFEDLAHLSFFQKYPRCRGKYVIHDLMHDMAQLVSKDECFIVKDTKDLLKIPQNVRHLMVLKGGDVKCSDLSNLCKHSKLRTLLCNKPLKSEASNTVMEKWCTELLCMRVMVCSSISRWGLPGSISKLKHLRYLKTDVVIKCCKNLSSLEQFLQPGYVPIIKKIEISQCESLESVPTDRFGDFRFLEVLHVSHCPMIISQRLFAPSLKDLYLNESGNLGGNIECSSLTILDLWNCPLESIELQMWNLPLVKELKVTDCHSLTSIKDAEPISPDLSHGGARRRMVRFPFLTRLTIRDCKKLETIDDLMFHLPAIESIKISNCGLLSLPANRLRSFPQLKDLEILWCPSLNWQSGMLLPSSLQKLSLWNCGDFSDWFPSCLENLTSLESLEIGHCECIMSVPGHLWSSNLKSVHSLKFEACFGG